MSSPPPAVVEGRQESNGPTSTFASSLTLAFKSEIYAGVLSF